MAMDPIGEGPLPAGAAGAAGAIEAAESPDASEAPDAVTGASRKAGAVDAATGATRKVCEAKGERKRAEASADRVAQTIDAVTGATWTTRNTIMAQLFQEDLAARGDEMPAFRPPGV